MAYSQYVEDHFLNEAKRKLGDDDEDNYRAGKQIIG